MKDCAALFLKMYHKEKLVSSLRKLTEKNGCDTCCYWAVTALNKDYFALRDEYCRCIRCSSEAETDKHYISTHANILKDLRNELITEEEAVAQIELNKEKYDKDRHLNEG